MFVKVWMLSLSFPFAFVVGGQDWQGLQIFNVTTGENVRDMKVKTYNTRTVNTDN